MSNEPFHEYVCYYPYKGGHWSVTIRARSFEEAEERLRALGWGHIEGRVVMTLPGRLPAWIVALICWFKNWGQK